MTVHAAVVLERDGEASYPPRLRRAESFLGIHFDFHAGPDCTEIGKNTTPEMVQGIIEQVRPDYIQIDCKGHRGLSSYPTQAGNPAPGFVGDPLRVWREVTARLGVGLYLHYSGVWDAEAVRQHPEWARVNEDGKPDDRLTSVFGPYVDQLLIPQLKELNDVYGVDGVWVDGDCWAAAPDYSEAALAAWRASGGGEAVPRGPGDPQWFEFCQFQREAFRRYVRHYVEELHRHNPEFQITSNWAFSDHMPEAVTIDLDFLSGDYSLQDSVNSARFSARCLAPQGKPWDLMAWAFSGRQDQPGRPLKTVEQLQREAAVVLAQGGGFQAYFKQKRDGSIYPWQMRLMREVARFCRARQGLCQGSRTAPQIAVLYSTAAHYRQSARLFHPSSPGLQSLKGILFSLLDSQNSVEIRSEHHLRGRLGIYPLIVIPDWDFLEPEFREELVAYVKSGGSLLLVGARIAALFQDLIDATPIGAGETNALGYLEQDGWLAPVRTESQFLQLGSRARRFGSVYAEDDPRSESQPAAVLTRVERGWVAATWMNLGESYLTGRTTVARDFLDRLVRELFPHPIVEVSGTHNVEVVVARKDGALLVHLINTAGPHADRNVYTFDHIPTVGPLRLLIRTGGRPRRIRLEPGGEVPLYRYREGKIQLVIPSVELHRILVVE